MHEVYKTLAEQLKKPHGELAIQIAEKLNEVNETINKLSIHAVSLSPGDHIPEIGMCNGFFVKYLFERQQDLYYTGCDFSIKMIYEANRINESLMEQGRAKFIHADAAELPFEDGTFDTVLVIATLYYFEDLEKVFSEFHRVLKPKGQLVISIRPKFIMEVYGTSMFAARMFTKEDLVSWITRHGFRIMDITDHPEPDVRILEENLPSSCIIVVAEKI